MVIPAMLARHLRGQKAKRRKYTSLRLLARDPTVLGADAQRRQPETSGRGAGDTATFLAAIRLGPVEHQAGPRVRVFPEKQKCPMFQVFDERIVGGRLCPHGSG